MKFGEKYELRESLTTGAVETFVANDRIRGQKVLVHILDCGLQQPNQPTVQWALEAFRRVAPEPAGMVLEAGRYSGTLYAYIVTQMPEKAALMSWVQTYQAQATDTHEIPAAAAPHAPSNAPTADRQAEELLRPSMPLPQAPSSSAMPPKPTTPDIKKTKPDVDIRKTRLFAAPAPREGRPDFTSPPPAPPASSLGASNLDGANLGSSFFDGTGLSASKPGTPAEPQRFPTAPMPPPPSPPLAPPASPIIAQPPDPYRANLTDPKAPAPPAPAAYNPKPGEFTSFFQGPFHGDEPTPVRGMSPQEIEPPRKSVGEFTAVFGSLSATPPEKSPTIDETDDTSSGLNLGWLNDAEIPHTPNSTPPPPIGGLPRSASPPVTPPVLPQPPLSVASATPIFPTPLPPKPAVRPVSIPPIPIPAPVVAAPVVAPPLVVAAPLPPVNPVDVVRRAFSNPGIEPIATPPAAPSQPPASSGPSPYTQIIKRPDLTPAATSTGAEAAPAAGKPPAMPKIDPPKAPKLEAPEAPKLDKAETPKMSYWPLILTLTVLFFIAVLLVLYFVLKH